jgi:hypothetical protein
MKRILTFVAAATMITAAAFCEGLLAQSGNGEGYGGLMQQDGGAGTTGGNPSIVAIR